MVLIINSTQFPPPPINEYIYDSGNNIILISVYNHLIRHYVNVGKPNLEAEDKEK